MLIHQRLDLESKNQLISRPIHQSATHHQKAEMFALSPLAPFAPELWVWNSPPPTSSSVWRWPSSRNEKIGNFALVTALTFPTNFFFYKLLWETFLYFKIIERRRKTDGESREPIWNTRSKFSDNLRIRTSKEIYILEFEQNERINHREWKKIRPTMQSTT